MIILIHMLCGAVQRLKEEVRSLRRQIMGIEFGEG